MATLNDSLGMDLERLGPDTFVSLGRHESAVKEALAALAEIGASARIWARDGRLWAPHDADTARDVEERLGWLDLPRDMLVDLTRLRALALEIRAAGLSRVVLLGMGGSSLAPEVMAAALPREANDVELVVLDTTDPAQIRRVENEAPLAKTLFILASKSGTTAETDSLYAYLAARMREAVGDDDWHDHFVAITDPGTPLARLATRNQFRALYLNRPDIGGRYSALSLYGLVPAALLGIDLDRLLSTAHEMWWACRSTVPVADNPGAVLGACMAACAAAQPLPADKLTLITSPAMTAFGPWVEQLIAESTGKDGVGILPVEGERLAALERFGADRQFAYLRLAGDDNDANDALMRRLVDQGHTVAVVTMPEPYSLGAEFYRWEYATAVAGHLLGINPFDQPNVESAKQSARQAIEAYEATHQLPQLDVVLSEGALRVSGPAGPTASLADYLAAMLSPAREGEYVALMAYIDRCAANAEPLEEMRYHLGARLGVPVTLGYGPRFLHSTGQLHKGGPNTGLFVQIVRNEAQDIDIPARGYSFGVLKAAQALGDWQALTNAGRRVVCINIGADVSAGLAELSRVLRSALDGDAMSA
jgi:transaldolase/glucose-6-phosphate isomerase